MPNCASKPLPLGLSAADAEQVAKHLGEGEGEGEGGGDAFAPSGVVDALRWLAGANVPDPLPHVSADVSWRPKRRVIAKVSFSFFMYRYILRESCS